MRKKVVTFVMILALVSIVSAYIYGADNNVTYGWTRVMGGGGGGISDFGFGVAVDSLGNVYTTGYFSGTPDFGADFGTSDIKTSAGEYDIFITKIKADGTYGWTKIIGGTEGDFGWDITTDSSDNIYVTGYFWDTVDFRTDFGGGSDIKISAGIYDIFVMKINADGTYGWTKTMGGTGTDDGKGIVIDSSGNIYTLGNFQETVDFGSDFGTSDIKTSAGTWDIFITKINADGTYGWTKTMGGTGGEFGHGVSTDSSSNVYLTGSFFGTVDFGADFGASDSKTSAGYGDIFVTKINTDSSYGWTKVIGDTESDTGTDIVTDSSGNVYTTGNFSETVDFGADFGTSDIKTSEGDLDIFVTKINADSSYGWTRVFGSVATFPVYGDVGYGIDIDYSGNIYVTGHFQATIDFGLDFGTSDIKTSAGYADIFITKIKSNGTYGWTKAIGGTRMDVGLDIKTDTSGNIHLTGGFYPPVDFGLDFGTTDLKTFGLIFVTKLAAGPLAVHIDIKPGSDSNSIYLGSNGIVPVAIFSSPSFDATQVDPITITMADADVKARGNGTLMSFFEDVNQDGLLDIVVHVDITGLVLVEGVVEVVLEGETYDGVHIKGVDTIRIVPSGDQSE